MDFKKKKILIVDDEEDLCEILQYNFENAGYIAEVAYSAEDAIKKNIHEFDICLLDVMMGSISGFELAGIIRKEMGLSTPIIFLTAKDTEPDILTGFNLGADDYIAKPFSINELIARVNAVLNRTRASKTNTDLPIKFGDIEVDLINKRVQIAGKRLDLTKKEYKILKLFLENQGKIYSREDLLHLVWGDEIVVSERTVDVNITRLRNKLGQYGQHLKNKTGFGYFFEIEI